MSAGAEVAEASLARHLPVLLVIAPMLAAPLCVLVRRARPAWWVAMLVTVASLVLSCLILQQVVTTGTVNYEVGGWEPPWGIELRIELVNALVLVIVTGISTVVLSTAPVSLPIDVGEERHYLFYSAFLLCMTGLLGMTSAGDAFNVFVFLEISSLSSYTLIALGPTRRALIASFRYLMMGTVGGTFILLGVGLLYIVTGTLNIDQLGTSLAEVGPNRTVLVALACVVLGASVKLALFPFGIWLPNAYTFAPAMVTAFLAATATKVAYYVLVRFVFRIFGPELAFDQLHLERILMVLALTAMFVASAVAIFQQNVKRMLAYSSLAQIGYMVLGLSLLTVNGFTGGIVHLFNHALMKSGLFLALAAIALRVGSTQLRDLAGIGRQMPWTMAAFVGAGLSLIGVPLTAGFVSKWYLVLGALERGLWPVAVAILLSSLLALAYIWRVVEVAYFQAPTEGAAPVPEAPLGILVPMWLLVGATVFFGIFTGASAGVAEQAAVQLLGGWAP